MLVCVELPDSRTDPADALSELRSLAKTAGAIIVDEMPTKRKNINPAFFVGSGKAEEIATRVKASEVDVVIFNNDLSPAQVRDLEKVVECKVLDRSELILDIFASRARTHEARLQVELAQMEYTYPRLRNMWSHLERMAGPGATMAGIGTRGPGEKQLEIDRRLVKKRVTDLKRELSRIDERKVRTVESRSNEFRICLVGYTNAGKSTLMNLLTGAGVLAEDKLFATLDTTTRRWRLGEGQLALLSDTVGFVHDLPHHLVASFRATLEEVIHADLLLHVADASHLHVDHQIASVNTVLESLKCGGKDQLLLLNKVDRVTDPATLTVLRNRYRGAHLISASTGQGAEQLLADVVLRIKGRRVTVTLRADVRNGKLMQYLARHAQVAQQHFDDTILEMQAEMGTLQADMLAQFAPDVSVLERSAVVV